MEAKTASCTYDLRPEAALCVCYGESGSFVLLSGVATVLGARVTPNLRYTYSHDDVRLETGSTARVQVMGVFVARHASCDGGLAVAHATLQVARQEAAMAQSSGTAAAPRALLVGGSARARATLCHALLNLATRSGRGAVAYVDLDVAGQEVACPGGVGVAFVEKPLAFDEGLRSLMPLDFFVGADAVGRQSRTRYLDVCASVEQAVTSVGQARPAFAIGGVVLRGMPVVSDLDKDLLAECLALFAVTHLIVVAPDLALENALRKILLGRPVRVMRVHAAAYVGGAVDQLCDTAKPTAASVMRYFCGTARTPLTPAKGVAEVAAMTWLNAVTLAPMTPDEVPTHALGAVVWANSLQAVPEANVAGYVVLLEVGRRYFSFMAPAAGELPRPYLLVSPCITLPPRCVPPLSSVD